MLVRVCKFVFDEMDNWMPLFKPNNEWRVRWDAFVLFLTLYTATLMPFEIAFVDDLGVVLIAKSAKQLFAAIETLLLVMDSVFAMHKMVINFSKGKTCFTIINFFKFGSEKL